MERYLALKIREDLYIIWDRQDKKVIDCTDNAILADEIIKTLEVKITKNK